MITPTSAPPWPPLRCVVTGNLCGTDTRQVIEGKLIACTCSQCEKYGFYRDGWNDALAAQPPAPTRELVHPLTGDTVVLSTETGRVIAEDGTPPQPGDAERLAQLKSRTHAYRKEWSSKYGPDPEWDTEFLLRLLADLQTRWNAQAAQLAQQMGISAELREKLAASQAECERWKARHHRQKLDGQATDDDYRCLEEQLAASQAEVARLAVEYDEQRSIAEGYRGAYERVLGEVEREKDKQIAMLDEIARLRSPAATGARAMADVIYEAEQAFKSDKTYTRDGHIQRIGDKAIAAARARGVREGIERVVGWHADKAQLARDRATRHHNRHELRAWSGALSAAEVHEKAAEHFRALAAPETQEEKHALPSPPDDGGR